MNYVNEAIPALEDAVKACLSADSSRAAKGAFAGYYLCDAVNSLNDRIEFLNKIPACSGRDNEVAENIKAISYVQAAFNAAVNGDYKKVADAANKALEVLK